MTYPFRYSALLANIAYASTRKWAVGVKPKKSLPKRLLTLTTAGLLYLSLWSSILCFNVKFDGEQREAGTLVYLSVCLSVCLCLSFKILGLLVCNVPSSP